jgi:hypothetical protein
MFAFVSKFGGGADKSILWLSKPELKKNISGGKKSVQSKLSPASNCS